MGLVFAAVVSWAPGTRTPEGSYPFSFYMVVLSVYAVHQVIFLYSIKPFLRKRKMLNQCVGPASQMMV